MSSHVATRRTGDYNLHVRPGGAMQALCGALANIWRDDPQPVLDAYRAAPYACQRCIYAWRAQQTQPNSGEIHV